MSLLWSMGFKMQSKQKMKVFQPWSKWASSSAAEIYLDRERAHRSRWSSVLWGSTFPIPEVTQADLGNGQQIRELILQARTSSCSYSCFALPICDSLSPSRMQAFPAVSATCQTGLSRTIPKVRHIFLHCSFRVCH